MIFERSILSQVVMASKASRLLKSVRLMLAREKSYDVSQAEEGKRGRKSGRTAYQHRFVEKTNTGFMVRTRPTNTSLYTTMGVNNLSEHIPTVVANMSYQWTHLAS